MWKSLNNMFKTVAVTGLLWMGFDYFLAKTLEFIKEFKVIYTKK